MHLSTISFLEVGRILRIIRNSLSLDVIFLANKRIITLYFSQLRVFHYYYPRENIIRRVSKNRDYQV